MTNAEMQKLYRNQKSALTRAINAKDSTKVEAACRKAVQEWDELFPYWPDDWARWERALNDSRPWNDCLDLRDLV